MTRHCPNVRARADLPCKEKPPDKAAAESLSAVAATPNEGLRRLVSHAAEPAA